MEKTAFFLLLSLMLAHSLPICNGIRNADFGNDLAAQIQQQVNDYLKPLDGLEQRIQNDVEQQLVPVRILESKQKIRNGQGGITIATYSPSGKVFVVQNGNLFKCSAAIDSATGACSGSLEQFQDSGKTGICYKQPTALVNDQMCFSSDGSKSISVTSINGKVECKSYGGAQPTMMSVQDFKNLCASEAASVTYKYYAAAPLNNPENAINCSGSPQVCTLTETVPQTESGGVQMSSSNIYIGSSISAK